VSYTIEWRPSARKEVRGLDPAIRRRVLTAIEALADDPRLPGSVTLAGSPGWRRIRIGSYRVIYDINDRALVVLVLRVGSRGSVYRTL
jgi:mRNA interferase RelE/StbE